MFVPSVPLLETFIRGTCTYLALFLILRVVLKRQSGALSITDMLVLVMISDAAQNAMASDYKSITDGVLLVVVIVFWSYAMDWLQFRFPTFERLVMAPPLPLVKDGQLLRRNMRRELVTEAELMSHLREQGVEGLDSVKAAMMEPDGRISVICNDGETPQPTPDRPIS